jgi:ADP-dependent NAD(P)H-hydrate dehydratase / NAD(P)H-hydrate epimerase
VIPVLTPDEMAGVDRNAPEPVDLLIERAGFAVARAARRMLGGSYGKRVVVVAGRGNNGGDGRAAARLLARWGTTVAVLNAVDVGGGRALPEADLVIDAAYGTGLSRPYDAPDPGPGLVLAVDIPSGLSGRTGRAVQAADPAVTPAEQGSRSTSGGAGSGGPVRADRTVTFAAYKPGLLLADGPEHAGIVEVVDIGLGRLVEQAASMWLLTDADVQRLWPRRPRAAHKWQSAVQVVAGSPGMYGAPMLVTRGALRGGAGYVVLGVPGAPSGGGLPPGEQVAHALPATGWDEVVASGLDRVRALVVGPGLGQPETVGAESSVAKLLRAAPVPAVVDADGLRALGDLDGAATVVRDRPGDTVLTPHDGEFARLVGRPPGEDRIGDVRAVADRMGAVVLLKGSPTIVAAPDGRVLIANSGSPRLATAGTGDVLSGVIGAFLARGLPILEAAALGAHVHGRAASLGPAEGLVASDLPPLVSRWLSEVCS